MDDNPDGVDWPNGDNLPLADYYRGSGGTTAFNRAVNATTDMECFTCHAAHDGVDSFMLRVNDNNSRICVGCHTTFVATSGANENPSNLIAEYQEAATARLGSHYTGTVVNSNATIGEIRWTYSGSWTDTTSSRKQTSHWTGGGAGAGSQGTRLGLRMQCQSCHTPHDAATGLVEANGYDGSITDIDFDQPNDSEAYANINFDGSTSTRMAYTPTTALLLGNNASSKMCATCHWPVGTHVTTIYTVIAKPDAVRVAGGAKKKYRNYCSRNSAFIISILNGEQETQYNVWDLIADGNVTGTGFDGIRTPESPCNFPPLQPGVVPTTSGPQMLCDSCHAPHGAATGSGAFILEAGSGDASAVAVANQRVAKRNYQDLCWLCHDK
jgi:predicted CXXCH cytochrome family protein